MSQESAFFTMRVAYVIPFLKEPSGWRSHACGFINAVSKYVEPVLFVANDDYEAAKALFPEYPLISLPATQQASLNVIRSLPRLAASLWAVASRAHPKVDLVHSLEAYPTGLVGSWLAKKLKASHVLTTHGTYGISWYNSPLDKLAYRKVLRKLSVLCPVSHGTASLIRKYFGNVLTNVRIQPILNGNSYFKAVSRSEAVLRESPPIPTVLSVGSVKARKGYHISLQVFARVKKELPTARYWIVGDIEQEAYYQDLLRFIAAEQLGDVEFLGVVSEERLGECYRGASVFLLAPQQVGLSFEGFGLVYLEAGAYGLPVVGTRTGGVPDAVRDGITGFLADPGDVTGLTDALLRLLNNMQLARQMGRANRDWAETLTWERCAHEQYAVYLEVTRKS